MKMIEKVIFFLFFSKKKISKPKKNKILIFDGTNCLPVLRSLKIYDIEKLCIRGEELNFYIVLKTLQKKFYLILQPKLFWKEYIFNYIHIVDPKIVITFIDNNPFFYTLKKKYSSKIFISIQNGYRFKKGDIFGNLSIRSKQNLACDYVFCFNKNVAKLYRKFIKCKTIVIGSLKNNLTKISSKKKSDKILLISSYGLKSETIEKKLIPILLIFCKRKNFKLLILGRTGTQKEMSFYEELNNSHFFDFYNNQGQKDLHFSYNLIDNCNTIISLNATLGYEALGRGKKTIFLNFNNREINCKSYVTYNWPSKFSREGFNWLTVFNKKKILRKLEYISNLSNKKWSKKYKNQYNFIMPIDYHNKKLKNVIKKSL